MKVLTVLLVTIFVFCGLMPSFAQAPGDGLGMKIVEVQKNNAALTRQYTWNCRMELLEKDNLKDIHIDDVSYGPNGQLKRIPLNNFADPCRLASCAGPWLRQTGRRRKSI
jgi:hypothetical protein